MFHTVEKYILLLTVFSAVFGTSLYIQGRILSRRINGYNSDSNEKSGKLIDWLIIILITGFLAYLLR